jgi:hypothetical protein
MYLSGEEYQRRVKERRSLSYTTPSPSPLKERGIKRVR